ncbi:MAG TPA: hypothetical protein VIU11_24250 [Nakamurella sp.]
MTVLTLHDGWTLRAIGDTVPDDLVGVEIPAAIPGCVHTDLLRAGLITDPFDGDAETSQQWIGDTVWEYRGEFDWSPDGSERHDLVADGLDTVATLTLNGIVVGRTENQHRSYRFEVGPVLRAGRNELAVQFAAPVPEAHRRSAAFGSYPHVNHHPYNALRKMACNFGWDWGIDVATSGIVRPLFLHSWSGVRIASVRPLVDLDGDTGVLTAHVELERATSRTAAAELFSASGVDDVGAEPFTVIVDIAGERTIVTTGGSTLTAVVRIPQVQRWWPIGHGAQPLYDLRVTAAPAAGGGVGAAWTGRIGFRTVELVTAPDADGSPFEILVNGMRVLIRGANWIPDHAFLTEIDADRYARRILDAVEANMNLLRVWGGGIYESEDFYRRCDELGVLVWQDFLFACAAYAEEPWLAGEVEAEAREAITRLSAHPSLILWNGNNESIWGYVDWDWRRHLAGRTWGDGYYRRLLPGLLAELDPTRPYSDGSPFSFSDYLHPNDPAHGTMHIWDVWNREDYTTYREHRPRFVSEFGFQGPPAFSTLTRVVHDTPLEPYGHQMLVHQKAIDGNLKLERGMRGHLPAPATFDDWHWATQLNQAHAIRYGIEHFRSLTPYNTGAIVWQLNDNWPVVSWAAVDFDENRKPVWYALRAAFQPRLLTVQPRAEGPAAVLVNDTAQPWAGQLLVQRIGFEGVRLAGRRLDAQVAARSAITVPLPEEVAQSDDPTTQVLVVNAVDTGPAGTGFPRAIWNYAEVIDQGLDPDPLDVAVTRETGGYRLTVTARSYVRDITVLADRVDPRARVDEALLTLLPTETVTIAVTSAVEVTPDAFAVPTVLRHANGLHAAATAGVSP